jgi:hypothetical protein
MNTLLNAMPSGHRIDNLSKLLMKLATLFKLCMWGLQMSFRALWTVMFARMISAKASFDPTTLEVSTTVRHCMFPIDHVFPIGPVTSVFPTVDGQTYLVQSLDSTIRLMDAQNGKLLNTFKGHVNDAYRSRACFGHAEASVVSGDEQGCVWAWDLVDVSFHFPCSNCQKLRRGNHLGHTTDAQPPSKGARENCHLGGTSP